MIDDDGDHQEYERMELIAAEVQGPRPFLWHHGGGLGQEGVDWNEGRNMERSCFYAAWAKLLESGFAQFHILNLHLSIEVSIDRYMMISV